jgi:hypothetical protein
VAVTICVPDEEPSVHVLLATQALPPLVWKNGDEATQAGVGRVTVY